MHDYVPFESLLYVYDVANDVENKNYAAFVHADYRLTDHWGFTAGGRYTYAKAYFLGGQSDLNDFPFLGSAGLYPSCTGAAVSATSRTSPTARLAHLRSHGGSAVPLQQRRDGVRELGQGLQGRRLDDPPVGRRSPSPKAAEFKPEYSKTWELGLKSDWFNHRLRANAAVFYTDYDGIQLNIQQGISPVYTNAGNAKIKGAELEMQSLVGGGLQFNVVRVVHRRVLHLREPVRQHPAVHDSGRHDVCPARWDPPICDRTSGRAVDRSWMRSCRRRRSTSSPSIRSTTSRCPTRRRCASSRHFTYTAEMFNDSLNTPELRRPPTRALDASIHYVSPEDLYDFAVGGTNLTNDRYVTAGSPNYGAGEVGGYFNRASGTVVLRVLPGRIFEP